MLLEAWIARRENERKENKIKNNLWQTLYVRTHIYPAVVAHILQILSLCNQRS